MNARHVVVDTTLGPITIVAEGEAITGAYFAWHARRPGAETTGPRVTLARDELLAAAADQLAEYLDGARREFDLPLRAEGNAFQKSVWEIVGRIPFARTMTYGEIAAQLGDRRLAQKVGQAVGANPLCVLVPCHRVIGAGGSLTGYAGGLVRKRALLDLEAPVPAVSSVAGRLF
jgi:methylated-DNA-[protein]-cysteine S-methyltransferase